MPWPLAAWTEYYTCNKFTLGERVAGQFWHAMASCWRKERSAYGIELLSFGLIAQAFLPCSRKGVQSDMYSAADSRVELKNNKNTFHLAQTMRGEKNPDYTARDRKKDDRKKDKQERNK